MAFRIWKHANIQLLNSGYNPNQTRADCTRQCGHISVQFPFGLEDGCFAREEFHLFCTNATSSAALKLGGFQVFDLNVNEGLIKYTDPFLQAGDVYAFNIGRNLFTAGFNLVDSMQFAAANLTCIEAQHNISGYACVSTNSRCVEVHVFSSYVGYRCRCSDGFKGNPYIHSGCQGTRGISPRIITVWSIDLVSIFCSSSLQL